MTEKLTEEEREEVAAGDPVSARAGAKALRIIDAHEAERAALVAVIERVRARLYYAWKWGEPCPDPSEVFEALAVAGAPAPDPKRRPGMTKQDLGILLDTMGGELAAANARLEPTMQALNTERAARIDITEKLDAANAQVAKLEARVRELEMADDEAALPWYQEDS